MYIIYNEHPQTLIKSVISVYETYNDAVKYLKEIVVNYITTTKLHQQIVFIDELYETAKFPDCKYFIMVKPEYSDRYMIYERKTETVAGWLWNYRKVKLSEAMMFSIMFINTIDKTAISFMKQNIIDDKKFVKSIKSGNVELITKNNLVLQDMKKYFLQNKKLIE